MAKITPAEKPIFKRNLNADEVRPVLQVENLSKRFGPVKAVQKVSFEIYKGEVIGFLGPNGAGKTTAMRMISGFFAPSGGKVWINGRQILSNAKEAKKHIGYLPETVALYGDMRVRELLDFFGRLKGLKGSELKKQVDEKIAKCSLGDVRHRLVGRLSKGYRQRVGLAQALLADPPILILDEPTSGLDPKQIADIRALIRDVGKDRAVILSTHILPEVSMICDRVLMINKGQIVASGTVDELENYVVDKQEVMLTVRGVEHNQEVERILSGLEKGQDVVLAESPDENSRFALMADKGVDLVSDVSEALAEARIPILEIKKKPLMLEDIFLKLTEERKKK